MKKIKILIKKNNFKKLWRIFRNEYSLKEIKDLLDKNKFKDIVFEFEDIYLIEILFKFKDCIEVFDEIKKIKYSDHIEGYGYYLNDIYIYGYKGNNIVEVEILKKRS